MAGVRVGVAGATGLVGMELVRMLEGGILPLSDLKLFASAASAGRKVRFQESSLVVEEFAPAKMAGLDLAFFAVGTEASRLLVPQVVREGVVVIDKSNAFRMDPSVPLLVPGVNPEAARSHQGLISSPNCSTIQLVLALSPLKERAGLRRVLVTSFQSVSGSGLKAMSELEEGSRRYLLGQKEETVAYPHPISFNLIPHIDSFNEAGYTGEEEKLRRETRKILGLPDLPVSATCVRVPVFVGHSESVLVETDQPLSPPEAREILQEAPRVRVVDNPSLNEYPLPRDVAGTDEVLVGRIRRDQTSPQGLWLWVVADNLRIGAATNALDIARLLWQNNLI